MMMRRVLALVLLAIVRSEEYKDPLAPAKPTHPPYFYQVAEPNDDALAFTLMEDPRQGNFNFLRYSLGLLIDPCKGDTHNWDCCMGKFGEPEYLRESQKMAIGWVWAIAKKTKRVFKCEKPCVGVWEDLADTSEIHKLAFDWIDADETTVWAIDKSEKKLFSRVLDGSKPWKLVSGNFASISASSPSRVYALEEREDGLSRRVLECKKPCTGQWQIPVEVEGHPYEGSEWSGPPTTGDEYIQIDADDTHTYVLTQSGNLFMRQVFLPRAATTEWRILIRSPESDERWESINREHTFKYVTTSVARNMVVAIDESGSEVCTIRKPISEETKWNCFKGPLHKNLIRIDADMHFIWAVSEDGKVYIRRMDFSSLWATVPASNDDPLASVEAQKTFPEGGFSFVTPSSHDRLYVAKSLYSVEESSRDCIRFNSQDSCDTKVDELCVWNDDLQICEKRIGEKVTRLPNEHVTFDDPTCVLRRTYTEFGMLSLAAGYSRMKLSELSLPVTYLDPQCVDLGVRKSLPESRPPCWDNNQTVVSSHSCFDQDGNLHPTCVTVGFTSSTFISQCGGKYADDPECGTFLELHAPRNETVINEVRIPKDTKFTSGFRTLALSLRYGDSDAVICNGNYEIWWVQRTRKLRIVEYKKPFAVSAPLCDWNEELQQYDSFSSLHES